MKKVLCFWILFAVVFSVQAQNFKYGKVSEEELLEEVHPLEKDANAAVLFREHRVFYEVDDTRGFSLVTEVHERVKIYNKDGFDWATKEVLAYQNGSEEEQVLNIKGVTYNMVDGKLTEEKLRKKSIFKEDVNKYQIKTSFTMPAVTEGSVIEYQYMLRSPFITSIDRTPLQYSIPINRLQARVAIPEFFGFRMHFNSRSPVLFEIDQERDYFRMSHVLGNTARQYLQTIYSLEKDAVPSLKSEPFVGYLKSFAAYLDWEMQYTEFPNTPIENLSLDWEGVSKTIFSDGGYDRALDRSNFFDDELDKVLEGKATPEEKALAVYRFAKNKVKWNGFYGFLPEKGTRESFKDGTGNVGDVNLLLTAMLRYAGLKAHPVLVSTEDNGIPFFPTRKGFNYVISAVELQGEQYLLDATEANAAFGELPSRARNWQGRILYDGLTSDWVNLMPQKTSSFSTVMYLNFEEDLSLSGKTVNLIDGLFAKSYRDNYADMDESTYLQNLEKDKGNIDIQEVLVENKKQIGSSVKETYEFLLKDGLEEINDRIYLQPLLFERIEENPFKEEERLFPIFFNFPRVTETLVNIKIPEGYVVESLPESGVYKFTDGGGTYKFIVSQNGNFLRVQSSLEWSSLVYPAIQLEGIKNFYEVMVDKNAEAIVLKKV